MRSLIGAVAFTTLASVCLADGDRPKMLPPPPEEEAVKDLLGSLSSACSEKNFRRYVGCFTPDKASAVKKSMEDTFICHDLNMEVLEHFIISSDEESIVIGLRYKMDKSGEGRILHSRVVLKSVDGEWKIDSEQVKKVDGTRRQVQTSFIAGNPDRPDRRNLPGPKPQWRFPDPANGGEEAWLPRDIGYTPGPSCANGQCGIR